MNRVYLDHNSTTALRPEAREAWLEVVDDLSGNPSSLHAGGRRARDRIDLARERVALALGVHEDDIVFTSGGTESNNAALFGAMAAGAPGSTFLTSVAEHSAVLEAADTLEARGYPVVRIGVDSSGAPRLDELEQALAKGGVSLVSLTAANNEVGALTDLHGVARLLGRTHERPRLHIDAVQALGRIVLDLDGWGADFASFSAHKVGGPVGVGVLIRRRSTPFVPLVVGGGQERGLRAGTENTAGIVAASVAIELAVREREATAAHTSELVHHFWSEVATRLPGVQPIGPALDAPRLPNTLNVSFPDTDGKVLVTRLDLDGLAVSAGSACASGSIEPSHVLLAMGLGEDVARAGLRVSFGRTNNRADSARAVEILVKALRSARAT